MTGAPQPRRLSRRALLGALGAGLAGGGAVAGVVLGEPHGRRPGRPGAALRVPPTPAPVQHTVVLDGLALPYSAAIAAENARPGSTDWPIRPGQRPRAIEGYAGTVSAVAGQGVPLYVSTSAASFIVSAYRIGYYGGRGARLVWRSGPQAGRRQPVPAPHPGTNLVECSWAPSLTVPVSTEWPPGVYLLKLLGDGGEAQYVPLTVRDDTSRSSLLLMNAVTTWQAYNRWGGYSLYSGVSAGGASFADRARVVSFDRPYTTDFGNGAADLLGNEIPFIALLERHGLDVSYWTDVDLAQRPDLVLRHGALLSMGHDEYWSGQMRAGALRARDAGVNLGFFGANACYRHIRLDAGPHGPARREVCYKIATEDPLYGIDNARVTANWPSGPDPRPESELIGDMYRSFPADAPLVASASWLFAGTGLSPGDRIPHVVGSEFDGYDPALPGPRNLDVLAHSPVISRGVPTSSDATWYTVPAGGGVFASGTANWVGLLADSTGVALEIIPGATPGVTPLITRATLNVLAVLGGGPGSRTRPSAGTWRRYYRTGQSTALPAREL